MDVEIFSSVYNKWFFVEDILADPGADVSVLPYNQGQLFVEKVEAGDETELYGIVPYVKLTAYIHRLNFRINNEEFTAAVAIAETDDVPPILGREEAINKFTFEFDKGTELRISC
jgi:hypothetical protein